MEAIAIILAAKLIGLFGIVIPLILLFNLERAVDIARRLDPRWIWDWFRRIAERWKPPVEMDAPNETGFECVVCREPEAACQEKYYVCSHQCVCAACYEAGRDSLARCPYCRARKL